MKRFILLTSSLVFLIVNVSFSQSRAENKKKFFEAEGFILFEEYQDALASYLKLIKLYPENNNLKYRIGQCYINIPAEKEKAIPYLEEAVQNINPDYREGRFKEKGAPYDAYYFLANSYRINNQLDKALETYEIFKKNLDTKVYNPEVVNLQIQSCYNAKELMKTPLYLRKQNLGKVINDEYPDLNPVVSGDGNFMVYNRLTAFQEALFYVKKVNGNWSNPVNIIPDLGLGREEGNYATSLSRDGKELYIYRRELDYDGNIYVTKKISNDRWSNIVRLNDNINTKYWESHATVSHDGKKLYFTSNRKDSYGGLDIYVSERDTGNAWGPAVNLGPVINSVYNEETPFLSEDDRTIFFSSAGHFNMGGYDIFYSTLQKNGQWSVPQNAGYPLNTTDDDLFFHPLKEGYEAYYSMIDAGGYGLADLYHIEIFSDSHPRKFIVRGNAKIEGLANVTPEDRITIKLSNIKYPERSVTAYTDPATGVYESQASQGDYIVSFEALNAEKITQNLNIPLTTPSDTVVIPGVILPKTDRTSMLAVEEAKSEGNDLLFRVTTEPGSVLVVEKWAGDSLVSSEQFNVKGNVFEYKTSRQEGVDKLTFRSTDRYGNVTAVDVPVAKEEIRKFRRPVYKKYVAPQTVVPVEKPAEPAVDTTRKEPVIKPAEPVVQPAAAEKGCKLWYLWLLLGFGIIIILFILRRKRRKDKES